MLGETHFFEKGPRGGGSWDVMLIVDRVQIWVS
jgi:hypothetical protein